MGFISTGETYQLSAYLTQKGRELLLNGIEADVTAKYFVLGDSDTNYHSRFWLDSGFVPDLTGDNTDCVQSLANNIGIKYPLPYSQDVPEVPYEVRFLRADNNTYHNTLDCLVHLDRIARYQLFHSYGNQSNSNRLKTVPNLKSTFADLFNKVVLLSKSTATPTEEDFGNDTEMVFEMLFEPNIFRSINSTFIETSFDNTVYNVGKRIKSPLVMTFSSLDTPNGSYKGAGKMSVGIFGREIGYLYKTEGVDTYDFLNATSVEGVKDYTFYTDENNRILNKYTDFIVGSKITGKDSATGVIRDYFYRGDKNLTNINDNTLQSFSNDVKFANQYAKLFADPSPIVDGGATTGTVSSLMKKEVLNLKDYVETATNIFSRVDGTNEFRSVKLTFNVYPKNFTGSTVTPATLNIIFKFDEDEMLNGDSDYENISNEGDTQFVQYEFVSTNGTFYNKAKTRTFTRTTCGENETAGQVSYTIQANTFSGGTPAIAEQLAEEALNTWGQAHANSGATCTAVAQIGNDYHTGYYYNQTCDSDYAPQSLFVSVLANSFYAPTKYEANQMAAIFAQERANSVGLCYPMGSGGGSGGSSGGGGCLLPGQRVFINEKFDTKAIEDFVVGDTVYTGHEKTLEIGTYTVERIYKTLAEKWYHITTVDGREIECSPTHLFVVNGVKIKASELQADGVLDIYDNGEFKNVNIKNINIIDEPVEVYNVEVTNAHTYITENMIFHHNRKAAEEFYPELAP